MTIEDFKTMLAIQNTSRRESGLVDWLLRYSARNLPGTGE